MVASNSLIFKASLAREPFENWLKPYEHFIPVEMDLSDLGDKVEWAIQNDEEARKIAENGSKFVRNHLKKSDFDCYVSRLLLEMASLMGIKE